jgi:hypothetical protein
MPNPRTATFTLLAAGLLVSSCSSQAGNATPASPAPPSSSGLRFGAPPVPAPLDPAPLEKTPCAAMTEDQVAGLGAPPKSAQAKPTDPLGPSCTWRFATDEDGPSSTTGAVFTADPTRGGISGLYGKQQLGGTTRFEPFSANGYPGVIYNASTSPPPGSCALAVGIRDDLTYTISVDLDGLKHPFAEGCELGKKVAGFVVSYLQKGAR